MLKRNNHSTYFG